jgi:cell wall-associated NlpC family hydrolase
MTIQQRYREAFGDHLKSLIGEPYQWGGHGMPGYDCSGAIVESLRSAGFRMLDDLTSQGLYERFKNCEAFEPQVGNLYFYGQSLTKISHVMGVIRVWPHGRAILAGARGGDGSTSTYDQAWEKSAMVGAVRGDYWAGRLVAKLDPFKAFNDE